MDHTENDALRFAVGATRRLRYRAARIDRVCIDVECIRGVLFVLQLHVTGVDLRALRQRIRIADFPLLRSGVGALGQPAYALAVDRPALAVQRVAPKEVEGARADRRGHAEAVEVAR